MRHAIVLATMALLPVLQAGAGEPEAPELLEVYLPRKIPAQGDTLTLANVGVVRCDDVDLYRKACAVRMGRTPWVGETITVDRRTVLSRLVASGIAPERIRLTGAMQVTLHRHDQLVPVEEILRTANAFLANSGAAGQGAICQLINRPQAMSLPAGKEVSLRASRRDSAPSGRLVVVVEAVSDGKVLAEAEVVFAVRHRVKQAVATREIPIGAIITPENARIETVDASEPQEAAWRPPFGLPASQVVRAGAVITPAMLARAAPAVAIKRNQPVMMRVSGPGFIISGIAQALEDGRPGEFIRVRNIDTKRIIVAKVTFDGTVEPVVKR